MKDSVVETLVERTVRPSPTLLSGFYCYQSPKSSNSVTSLLDTSLLKKPLCCFLATKPSNYCTIVGKVLVEVARYDWKINPRSQAEDSEVKYVVFRVVCFHEGLNIEVVLVYRS